MTKKTVAVHVVQVGVSEEWSGWTLASIEKSVAVTSEVPWQTNRSSPLAWLHMQMVVILARM